MIYLDASALIKLVILERESEELDRWLAARQGVPQLTSELGSVEVIRGCRRVDEALVSIAATVLAPIAYLALSRQVLDRAQTVGVPALRALDAIHLSSALSLGSELSAFVTYDRRLQAAAEVEGLPVVAPEPRRL